MKEDMDSEGNDSMDPTLLEMLTSINNRLGSIETRLGGIENRLGGLEKRMDGLEKRVSFMQNDIEHMRRDLTRVEQQDKENASEIRQLSKQIPPAWVTPLITSLLVAGIVLAITLATR